MSPESPSPIHQNLDGVLELLHSCIAPPAELLTRETFAALLAIGTSTFDRLRETGAIGPQPFRLAGLKWHRTEAEAWLRHRGPNGELHDSRTWPVVWESICRAKN